MFNELFIVVTKIMEFVGVAVIILGALLAIILYFKMAKNNRPEAYDVLRKTLGRSILLGLEFLVAADIINTVGVEPTMDSVLVLGVIVLIRTFLSFSIEVELEQKLPWKKSADGGKK